MRTLASEIVVATNTLRQPGIWVKLFEVTIDEATTLYYTDGKETILYNNKNYVPYPISVSNIEETSKPEMKTFEVSVANVDRQLSSYLESGKILGNRLKIIIVFVKASIPIGVAFTAPAPTYVSSWQPVLPSNNRARNRRGSNNSTIAGRHIY